MDLGHVKLKVDPNASARALPSRNIPLAIHEQVKEEIEELTKRGILIPVNGDCEKSQWQSPLMFGSSAT